MNRKIYKRILRMKTLLATFFILSLVFFLVLNCITPDRKISTSENRELASFPEFTLSALLDGSYFTDLNSYISDQFVFRDGWISLKSKEERWQGRKELSDIYIGSSGYLLAKPTTPNYSAINKTIEAMNTFHKKHAKSKMSVMIVPNASQILKDKLPQFTQVHNQLSDIRYIRNGLTSFTWLGAGEILRQHKNEYIYYHTDHHWTTIGAYDVYRGVAASLGVKASTLKRYMISDTFEGTLASQSGIHSTKDTVYVYKTDNTHPYYVNYPELRKKSASCYDEAALKKSDQYQVFFGGNHPLVEINSTNHNGKNLMVFKDSYANSFIPFLIPYYEKIIMVDPRYYYDNLSSAIQEYNINSYLFLYSANTFVNDQVLKDVLAS